MDNKPSLEEIALQITLHAMDNGLINVKPCEIKDGDTSIEDADENALEIIRFYNYVLKNLSADQEA